MSIVDEVSAQLKDAMRARDKLKTQALRNIRAAFLSEMKSDGRDSLTDDQCIVLLRRLAKQRIESIEAYTKGGREELAAAEVAEHAVIESFLPKLADEATTRAWIEAAIAQTGASSMKEMGKVMGALMGAHKGDIDGKVANRIVRELLG
jgi:uncharacterized protein